MTNEHRKQNFLGFILDSLRYVELNNVTSPARQPSIISREYHFDLFTIRFFSRINVELHGSLPSESLVGDRCKDRHESVVGFNAETGVRVSQDNQ